MPTLTDNLMTEPADKRLRESSSSPPGSAEKMQRILSVCIGRSADDKTGEAPDTAAYEEELEAMAEEYLERDARGEYFIYVRSKRSSNRDLRALREITKGSKLFKMNLMGKPGSR